MDLRERRVVLLLSSMWAVIEQYSRFRRENGLAVTVTQVLPSFRVRRKYALSATQG